MGLSIQKDVLGGSMAIKDFLTALRSMFLPQRRNACPHCGGIRCIGACQFNTLETDADVGQDDKMQSAPAPGVDKQG